jgi:hypothetical protein
MTTQPLHKSKAIVTMTIDPDVLEQFDLKRGLAPRSAAVSALMAGFVNGNFNLSPQSLHKAERG